MKRKKGKTGKPLSPEPGSPGSFGGYGGASPANITGAINEFEDNLNVDWNDERTDEPETTSVVNRVKHRES